MRSLTYVSSASALLDEDHLVALLEECRPRNQRLGVTGMLLYCDGNIMQVLEGPEPSVSELFARISRDRRHRDVIEMFVEDETERRFPQWHMGYLRTDRSDLAPEGFSDFLRRCGPADEDTSQDPAHQLLRTFRDVVRPTPRV